MLLRRVLDLLDRLRLPRSRADEIADVRRRLALQQSEARRATEDERTRARAIDALRRQMIDALDAPRACASCERPCTAPSGRRPAHGANAGAGADAAPFAPWQRAARPGFDGGACCAAQTAGVFSDDELYVLALAGTRPSDFVAPPGPHAGCAFRDASGCTLAVRNRPTICLRYLCHELQTELQAQGRRHSARAIARDMRVAFEALVAERRERAIDALLRQG